MGFMKRAFDKLGPRTINNDVRGAVAKAAPSKSRIGRMVQGAVARQQQAATPTMAKPTAKVTPTRTIANAGALAKKVTKSNSAVQALSQAYKRKRGK